MKNKNLLKIIGLVLASVSVASCGGKTETSKPTEQNSATSSSIVTEPISESTSISEKESESVLPEPEPVFEVKDYDTKTEGNVPTNLAELKTLFENKVIPAEANNIQSYTGEFLDEYGENRTMFGYAFDDNTSVYGYETFYKTSSSKTNAKNYRYYRSIDSTTNRFLSVDYDAGNIGTSGKAIVKDPKDSEMINEEFEISESEAKFESNSLALSQGVYDEILTSYDFKHIKYDSSDVTFTNSLSKDKKSITFTCNYQYFANYSDCYIIDLVIGLNGNLGLEKFDYKKTNYNYKNVNFTTDADGNPAYTLIDPTQIESVEYTKYNIVNGFKLPAAQNTYFDVSNYFYTDFEADICWEKNYSTIFTNKIEVGYPIKVLLKSFEPFTGIDEVKIVDSSNKAIVNYDETGYWYGLKEGTATLTLMSGAGVTKTVDVEIIPAVPTEMTVSLLSGSNSLYVGDSTDVDVVVEPIAASNEVTITENGTSNTGKVTIDTNPTTKLPRITATQAGKVSLLVTSNANSELTKTIDLTIYEKPTDEQYKTMLIGSWTSKFDYGYYDYLNMHVTFNEDGSGVLYDAYDGYSAPDWSTITNTPFKWTLNGAVVSLTFETAIPSDFSINPTSFTIDYYDDEPLKIQGTYSYYSYSWSTSKTTADFDGQGFTKDSTTSS